MKEVLLLFLVFLLVSVMAATDTYCSIFVKNVGAVAKIVIPIYALLAVPLWFAWKELYIVYGNAWQVGIVSSIPTSVAVWVGTYMVVGQLPSRMQIIALLIKFVAVIVSKMK